MSKNRQDHNSLVKHLIDHFTSLGLEIQYANYGKYQKPFVISRHPPDVIAFDKTKRLGYIGEAKVCTELEEERTKEQLHDFSSKIMRAGASEKVRLPLYVAIPHECNLKMTSTLKELHLDSKDNIHVMDF
ncbi:MAG: hypothetical protein QXN55_02645 [Candidatus Nitrosotenuis sp.]